MEEIFSTNVKNIEISCNGNIFTIQHDKKILRSNYIGKIKNSQVLTPNKIKKQIFLQMLS